MTDFGSDISTSPDLDLTFTPITGLQVVSEAITRRLQTPRGGLFYDPDYGLDLRAYLNESLTPAGVAALQSAIATECLKDERVQSADAAVTLDWRAMTMAVRISLVTADGPFPLVLSVDKVNVKALQG